MLKRTIIVLCFAAGMLQAQNLIQDPEFDNGLKECQFDGNSKLVKWGIITEKDGNKCLAFENLKYNVNKKTGKKETYCACWIGKEKGKGVGFIPEPGATYEVQFRYKGKVAPRVEFAEWNGPSFWGNMNHKKVTLEKKLVPSENWTAAKGSFTVSKDTKRVALQVELSGSETYRSLPPLGPAFMIDKVQITKKK